MSEECETIVLGSGRSIIVYVRGYYTAWLPDSMKVRLTEDPNLAF